MVGLTLLVVLMGVAGWRLTFGRTRSHPLAPALAGALLGMLVVGQVDSLLDMPRIAWMGYFLLAVALFPGALRSGRS